MSTSMNRRSSATQPIHRPIEPQPLSPGVPDPDPPSVQPGPAPGYPSAPDPNERPNPGDPGPEIPSPTR